MVNVTDLLHYDPPCPDAKLIPLEPDAPSISMAPICTSVPPPSVESTPPSHADADAEELARYMADLEPAVRDLIREYHDVFPSSFSYAGIPPMRDVEHSIQLVPDYRVHHQAPYRLSIPEATELKRQLEELLRLGFIKPSNSPWCAPVLFARKADGTLRLCIDYLSLNCYTVKNSYPMPRSDELFGRLAGNRFFTKIDLRSGYHQIRVAAADQPKTAFRSGFGHYEFTVMPFGLTNAPATFHRAMNDIFRDILEQYVLVYLDDILVYSRTLEDHLRHLRDVLDLLRRHGFYAKLSKCRFAQHKVDFLGHYVSDQGLHMDDAKITAIAEWPTPTSAKQLRSFLGLTSYYSNFIRGYARMGYPVLLICQAGVRESIWSFQWMIVMNDMDHDIILGRPWCANVEMIGMHLHDGAYMVDIEDLVTGRGELLRLIGTGGDTPKGKLATWSPSFEESVRKGVFARMKEMRERVEIMIEEAFNKEWVKMGLPQKKRRQKEDALGIMVIEKETEVKLGVNLPRPKEAQNEESGRMLKILDLLQLVKAIKYHKEGVDPVALAKFEGEVRKGHCLNGKLISIQPRLAEENEDEDKPCEVIEISNGDEMDEITRPREEGQPATVARRKDPPTVMDQRSREADEAYHARMLAWSTETKRRADDAATSAKKKAEDAEQAHLLALEQQRQHDEAAAKAADEERLQRREEIFSGYQTLLTMAAEWRTEAENGKLEDSENKIALLLSHLTDLLTTCITQQEDIHNLDYSLAQVHGRLRQLEQRPVAAPDASSSNTSDRLEALEMDVGSLKDGVQLQQTATQQLEQRICTAANHSSSEPRERTPKFDGQEIFCDSTKIDPISWFLKFELTLQLHYVKEHKHHTYLYSRSGGACQAWLDNLLSKYGVVVGDLHTKIRPRQQATSAGHVSRQQCHVNSREYHVSRPPTWSMLLRSQKAVMDQRSGEADEAYHARMLAWSTETKRRADDAATAAKKKVEDTEQARLLALEQQRQHDEAAAKAADEERLQRREEIFSGEQTLLTMASEWRTEAENGKLEDSENKIALLLSHLTDLLTTCITQQEDIHSLDDSLAQVHGRLWQLEQRLVAAPDPSSSNTSDRLEALEMDMGSLKDGVQLQQTATQQLEQRICTAANHSSSEPRERTPKFDGQEIFCDSTKTDPISWFRKFELTLQLHYVKEHKHHTYLYSRSGGACQAWLDNLLSKYGVVVGDLHTKISWDDLKAAWHKRFQVELPEIKAMDKLMVFKQGTLPSTDWIAEYQRLTSVPDIQMGFKAIRHYFISR
ncbi:hypothetical protein CBR_g23202 [Chara braunii]|uniref:Reverse transcriptase domain-containing protein n=1 Tax=Chara braunii TaxID=69332 RepID=A0A388JV57_CHABU|nr:hypothetical protein CBR_g23202 [Chara braunii]|eukprot:GBG61686.1 hypothetical protein CBR_g23202 [Chara braunii]